MSKINRKPDPKLGGAPVGPWEQRDFLRAALDKNLNDKEFRVMMIFFLAVDEEDDSFLTTEEEITEYIDGFMFSSKETIKSLREKDYLL